MHVETVGIDQIAALVADAPGDVVARSDASAITQRCGAVMRNFRLVVFSPVPVNLGIPVENLVVRLRIFPAQRGRVVLQVGVID